MNGASVPARMTAWQVQALGEPAEVVKQVEVPVPEPGAGEVLVQVWAATLNFPDVLMARGQYQERPPLPFTPGVEFCGIVHAVGAGVGGHLVGERVIGTTVMPHGSLAPFAIARAADVHLAPPGLDDESAAALHLSYQTGWFGLYRRAALRVGETLLVHAAAGGVGSAAVQLGRAVGARVIAVVGGPEKAAAAHALGADVVIDRLAQEVVPVVKQVTDGRGVDVVFDPVGGPAFHASTKVIGFEGRIVVVGFTSGELPEAAVNHALVKNYGILGLHWGLYRTRDPELVRRVHDDLVNLSTAGVIRPLVTRLPFKDVPEGLARLASGGVVGRLTVLPSE